MLGIFSRFPNLGPEGPEPDPSLRAQGVFRAAHPRLRLKRRLLRSKDGNGPWWGEFSLKTIEVVRNSDLGRYLPSWNIWLPCVANGHDRLRNWACCTHSLWQPVIYPRLPRFSYLLWQASCHESWRLYTQPFNRPPDRKRCLLALLALWRKAWSSTSSPSTYV